MHKKKSATAAAYVQSREREAQAAALRVQGLTMAQIGAQLRCNKSTVHRMIKRVMARNIKLADDSIEELRAIQNQRIEAWVAGIWVDACAGDTKAIDAGIKLLKRKAELNGLDAAVRYVPPDGDDGASFKITLNMVDDGPPPEYPGDAAPNAKP